MFVFILSHNQYVFLKKWIRIYFVYHFVMLEQIKGLLYINYLFFLLKFYNLFHSRNIRAFAIIFLNKFLILKRYGFTFKFKIKLLSISLHNFYLFFIRNIDLTKNTTVLINTFCIILKLLFLRFIGSL